MTRWQPQGRGPGLRGTPVPSPGLPRPPRGTLALLRLALGAASDPGQSQPLQATGLSAAYKPGCPHRLLPGSCGARAQPGRVPGEGATRAEPPGGASPARRGHPALRGLGPESGPVSPATQREQVRGLCEGAGAPRDGRRGTCRALPSRGATQAAQPGDRAPGRGSAPLPAAPTGAHSAGRRPPGPALGPAPRDAVPPRALPIPSPAVRSWDDPNRVLDSPRPADPEPGLQGNSQARRLIGNKGPTGRLGPVLRMRHSPLRGKGRSPKERWAGLPAPAQWAFFQIQGYEPTSPHILCRVDRTRVRTGPTGPTHATPVTLAFGPRLI